MAVAGTEREHIQLTRIAGMLLRGSVRGAWAGNSTHMDDRPAKKPLTSCARSWSSGVGAGTW